MIKITKEHKYFQMGNHIQPAARVHLPATIILETNDCYDGDMSPDKDCHIKDIDRLGVIQQPAGVLRGCCPRGCIRNPY